MNWILGHWDAIAGAAGALYGVYQRRQAAKARAAEKRTADDLTRIVLEAERLRRLDDLAEQTRAALRP